LRALKFLIDIFSIFLYGSVYPFFNKKNTSDKLTKIIIMSNKKNENSRRNFLKIGLGAGLGSLLGWKLLGDVKAEEPSDKVKLLSPDGKLVEVERSSLNLPETTEQYISPEESRVGIPGRKFVMVIDLAKCKNARLCVTDCQKGHHLPPNQEWMKVFLLQNSKEESPYWFPRNCFHCDAPSCIKVCPVGATYKRQDNIVLIDNERCIGCKFCIAACPYSARIFSWKHEVSMDLDKKYSPETGVPAQVGTVSKCDFCPDLSRLGKLPYCVSGCPMGVIYFGDKNEDTVTNGKETVRFSQLIEERSGYRFMEELGTEPNVYYLPPVKRRFDYEQGFDNLDEETRQRYEGYIENGQV